MAKPLPRIKTINNEYVISSFRNPVLPQFMVEMTNDNCEDLLRLNFLIQNMGVTIVLLIMGNASSAFSRFGNPGFLAPARDEELDPIRKFPPTCKIKD